MENTNNDCGYYAVLPASVRYDKALNAQCKLLYAEITALARKEGYCWAKNGYFADLYDVDEATVSRWLKKLVDKNYIRIERDRRNDGTYLHRKIFIAEAVISSEKEAPCFDEETAENDHIAKMQSGQKPSETHIANLQDSHFADLQDNNNINFSGINIINNDRVVVDKTRARATVTVEQFEKELDCEGWDKFPNGRDYRKVRDVLIELLNTGRIEIIELKHNDLLGYIGAMRQGTRKRRITDLRAYLFKAVKNNTKKSLTEAVEEIEDLTTPPEHELSEQDFAQLIQEQLKDKTSVVIVSGTPSFKLTKIYEAQDAWRKMLELLDLQINSLAFDIWVRPLTPLGYFGNILVISSPTDGSAAEVKNRFFTMINNVYSECVLCA